MSHSSAIAIIPARGGSKSVPRKNVLPFAGQPLIAHAILAARGALGDGFVFVSTDDAEIAEVARTHGAQVISRPDDLATDTASSEAALLHALTVLAAQGHEPSITVFLQCTSPFTQPSHVKGLVDAVLSGADSALTVRRSHGFLWKADDEFGAVGVNHDRRFRPRRQDLDPEYLETGAGYAFRTQSFVESGHRFFGKIALVETPDIPPIEIDDPSDFVVAETLWRARHGG
jgi:CMP-N-acetylneuraminic acid synthetase